MRNRIFSLIVICIIGAMATNSLSNGRKITQLEEQVYYCQMELQKCQQELYVSIRK